MFYNNIPSIDLHGETRDSARVLVMEFINDNIKLKNALENARVHRTYSKDAVKYLCLPFAYNISRYKALTIKDLFDWTEYSCKKDE